MKNFFMFFENLISGVLPFIFLCFCGVYLTFKSGFFQFRFLPDSLKYALGGIFRKEETKDGISPFQAACTALSATVGTGNIAGIAGAVALGGAGAVFWLWVSASAGMIVKVAEIILALKYQGTKNGENLGGPMYYIKNGLPKGFSFLAPLFGFTAIFAVFCSGNLTQTNAAICSVSGNLTSKLIMGIVFAALTGLVIIGGAKRIGIFTEKMVPFMAVIYIIMTVTVIIANIQRVPKIFSMIFEGAFNPKAVTGGIIGSVMSPIMIGASRGVFSNEAGLGTSAMVHASAEENEGVKQSLYGIFEVFTDTIVMCTLTALTILCSGVNIEYGKIASTELVGYSMFGIYGKSSFYLLAFMMSLFGISSVIGWGFYGLVCSNFVFGKWGKKVFVFIYPFFCVIGSVLSADTAWRLSSFFNGIMLCINVFAVMLLSDKVIEKINEFKKEVRINDRKKNRAFKKKS